MNSTCKNCKNQFSIGAEDLKFYQMISPAIGGKKLEMPVPTLCFACRHQKRLAFRNEINLYHRKCDSSGKQIISMYSPDKPYKIYDQHIWWSDSWNPVDFGQDFDFNKSFFEQYKELQLQVPRMNLNNINNENSDYCNLAMNDKNCYLVFTADEDEDCCYLRFADRNYRCFDCDYTYDSIDCYGCFDIQKCNNCNFSHKCINSGDLYMCYNMIGCNDCMGCANLRNKKFCIFNEQCAGRENFLKKKLELKLNTYSGFVEFKKKYEEFLQKQPRKYLEIVNCENSLGDYLKDCRNAYQCYSGFGLEDCKYMINCWKAKDCYDWDFVGGTGSERCHEMASSAYNMVNCHFCSGCWENNSDIYYSELCLNSQNLFGCIALRHKKYCILNKQYTKEEYEELVPRIVRHMGGKVASLRGERVGERESGYASSSEAELKNKQWGEFFPINLSAYAYNESVAYEYFPFKKEEVLKRGWKWFDDETDKTYSGPESKIPDDEKEADEDICKQILVCETTKKPYKIIPQELKFLKMKNLPIPRKSPSQRHKERMALRNPWALWKRKCGKCSADIMTTYNPKRIEPVYCEKCYLDAVG
ncbi:hypothetical protein A3B60_02455 [Candidatus Peregrinibacteria bacterium RIFCSPLOWO2_01_FULL_39_12]|nr:MAG: hypothetical protein A3I58_01480 [Candidatus Peregrinibacteria bacterium RIFCSPLOWO2_02_FULL_39_10]OGJ42619.1 MAG: hypothetical protein A3B60_02455 [Candidatus Peregrinibacteria bacterium RIFCSPLOWO2_01_FULL_39_12]